MFKKILCLALALLCLSGVLVSCGDGTQNPNCAHAWGEWRGVPLATCSEVRQCSTCGASETRAVPDGAHAYEGDKCVACGHLKDADDLSEALDFGGERITVLGWNDTNKRAEFAQTEPSDDNRLDAIYIRNQVIEERLNVTLSFQCYDGGESAIEDFVSRIAIAFDAEVHDFDLIASYSRVQGLLVRNGLVEDLAAIEDSYIDLEKPWWPAGISDSFKIGNSLYFVTGDISMTMIDNLHCIYFNKQRVNHTYSAEAEAYFASNPHTSTPLGEDTATNWLYEMVYQGNWTLDQLIALSGVGNEERGTYGLSASRERMSALYTASKLHMMECDENNFLRLSADWTSDKAGALVSKLGVLFQASSFHTDDTTAYTPTDLFTSGRSCFLLDTLSASPESRFTYSVLPLPKYDASQQNYHTAVASQYSVFSIFRGADDRGDRSDTLSMLTAVLECWASEAYRRTTPEILDACMQLKLYFREPALEMPEKDMCEIICSSVALDVGGMLGYVIAERAWEYEMFSMDQVIIDAAASGTEWPVEYQKYLNALTENLTVFLEEIK